MSFPTDTLFLSPLDSFHMKLSALGSWQPLVVSFVQSLGAGSCQSETTGFRGLRPQSVGLSVSCPLAVG